MEQKILDFANEKFRFEYPGVQFYPERLVIKVGTGAKFSGSFQIGIGEGNKRQGETVRGYFTCEDHRMKIEPQSFSAETENIFFTYDTSDFLPEEKEGSIFLISSHGEFELPYRVEPSLEALFYKEEAIRNLDDFIKVVKEDRKEGLSLFQNKHFDNLLLKDKKEERLIKKALLFSSDQFQAMEEFLCSLGVKERVRVSFDKKEYEFHAAGSQIKYKLFLRKNTWGYIRVKLECQSESIILSKTELTEKDFYENVCGIELEIDKTKWKGKRHRAELIFTNFNESSKVELTFIPMEEEVSFFSENKKNIRQQITAIKNFYQYRSGKVSEKELAASIRALLRSFGEEGRDENLYLSAYLEWLNGETDEVEKILSDNERWEKTPLAGTLHLYFRYLLSEEKEKQGLKSKMEELAKNFGVMEAYLFILKMEERFIGSDIRAFELLEKLYKAGMNKIFLFFEAWLLLVKNPSLFKKLDSFIAKIFIKVIRYEISIPEELKLKFIEMAMDVRNYNPLLLSTLTFFYEESDGKLGLEAIISQLLKSERQYSDSLPYLQKGIQKGIKLTGIYELYAKNIREDSYIEPSAYTYFLFGNSLPKRAKLMMYSYLMNNKEASEYKEIYKKYEEKLQKFALDELKSGEIEKQTLILYKEFIKDGDFVKKAGKNLSKIVYKTFVSVEQDDSVREVLILHEEFEKPVTYKLREGEAFVDKLREGAACCFSDREGRIFVFETFKMETLFRYEVYTNMLLGEGDDNILTALQFFRNANGSASETYYSACDILLKSKIMNENHCKKVKKELLSYFDRTKNLIRLEREFEEIDLFSFDKKEGEILVNIIFRNGLESHFYRAIRYLGLNHLNKEELKQFISYAMKVRKKEFFDVLSEAASRLITENIGNDDIFLWLADRLEGSAVLLFTLGKKLKERNLLNRFFVEKLMEQLLFTEEFPEDSKEWLFAYSGQINETLFKAFLNFHYYRWLLKEEELCEIIKKKLSDEALRARTLLPVISYLKVLSKKDTLVSEEKEFASMRLLRLVEDGVILPFFNDFIGKCNVPAEIENLKFAFCYADALDEISIQYKFVIEGEEENCRISTEWMKNVYLGIFVKQFLIFADERIKYHISILKEGEEQLVKNGELFVDPESLLSEDGRKSLYAELNQIFLARYIDDQKALSDYMKNYLLQRETLKEIFTFQFWEEDGR